MFKSRYLRNTAAMGFLVLFILLTGIRAESSTMPTDDQLLKIIPAESLFCIRVNHFEYTLSQIDQFLADVSPTPMGISILARTQLAKVLGSPELNGVNMNGGFVIFGAIPSGEQTNPISKVFIGGLVPVTDYRQLISDNPNCGQPDEKGVSKITSNGTPIMLVTQVGNYALISRANDYDKLVVMAKSISASKAAGLTSALDAAEAKLAMTEPIWVYGNVQQASRTFGPLVLDKIEEVKTQMKSIEPNRPGAPPRNIQTLAENMINMYVSIFETLMKETSSVSLTLRPKPTACNLKVSVSVVPGTDMANMFVADASANQVNNLLEYLEDGTIVNVGFKANTPFLKKLNVKRFDLLAVVAGESITAEDTAKLKMLATDMVDSLGGLAAFSFSIDAKNKPPFAIKYVIEVKDADKFDKVIKESIEMMNTSGIMDFYKSFGLEMSFAIKQDIERYKGVSIDSAKLVMKSTDPNSPQGQMMNAMFVDGFDYRWGIVNGLWVCTVSSEPDSAIRELIDQVKADGPKQMSDEMRKALTLLPEASQADFVVTYNFLRWFKMVGAIMPMPMPMLQMDIPTKSNIVFAGKAGNGKMVVDIALPKKHLMEIIGVFTKMQQQQKIMQQKQPGSPRSRGISSIPDEAMIWVKCNNPACKAEYQMSKKAYFKYVEKHADPMSPTAPPMVCEKCGEQSVFRAEKCTNPDCGIVFLRGSVPNDFADRCPKCNHSETEEIRKRRRKAAPTKPRAAVDHREEFLGMLEYVDHVRRSDLRNVTSVVISPDGNYAYTAAYNARAVDVFKRDKKTGKLEHLQTVSDREDLNGVVAARMSADGRYIVATAFVSNTVILFERDKSTGTFKIVDAVGQGRRGGEGLLFVIDAAISPDSRFAYAVAPRSAALSVFRITDEGKLELVETNFGEGRCFSGARGVAVSPKGDSVYVASQTPGSLVVLDRDARSGKTKIRQIIKDGVGDVQGLAGAFWVTCSPDDKFVYSCAGRFGGDNAICVFKKQHDGTLSLVQQVFDGQQGVTGLIGGNELVLSPDGHNVYALGSRSDSVVSFRRSIQTGKLTYLHTLFDGRDGVDGLGLASGIGISPDGEYVYVAAETDNAIGIFKRSMEAKPRAIVAQKFVIPKKNLQIPEELQACAANFRKIHTAIKKYEKDKGELPNWLSDLVPDYLNKKNLLCPNDPMHKAKYSPDPKIPCSYAWEFSSARIPSGWDPTRRTLYRDWKTQQVRLFGDVVPMVRCHHHGSNRVLNLSTGGQIYWGKLDWEKMFKPDYRFGDESPERQRRVIQPAGQLRIAGVARDEIGKPLEGVKLQVLPMSRGEVTSDSQGRFEVRWDPRRLGSRETVHYLVARLEERHLAVAVEIDEETKTLDVKLKPGVVFAGKVVDPDGKGISNARIMIMLRVSNWSSSLGRGQVADVEGKFEVRAIPAQHKYGVYARADGYGEKNVEVRADDAVGSRLELKPVVLALANLSVSGVVVDVNDKPVAEARISTYGEGQPRRSTQTDAEGKFTIKKICEGQIRITARVSGKTPSYGYVETEGRATDVKIVLQEPSISRYVPSQQRVKVTGVVRDEVGKPVDGVEISILPSGGRDFRSGTEGKFEVNWQPRSLGGRQREYYLVAQHRQRNLAAVVEIDEDTNTLDIKLKPGVIFAGKVVDTNGKGINGARIMTMLWGSNWGSGLRGGTVQADVEGKFDVRALPLGHKYSLIARAEGYGEKRIEVHTNDAVDNRMDVGRLVLAVADLSVSGVVVDSDDKPVANARVYCYGEGQPQRDVQTDTDGKFTLEKICAGRIRITASVSGKTRLYGYIQTEGGATDVKVVISERPSATRYIPKQPPSLGGKPLPNLKDFKIELSPADATDKMLLVCFWDMNQRPSRHCIRQLAEKAKDLAEKGVTVVCVQASDTDEKLLNEWVKEYKIPFSVGRITVDVEEPRFAWGVKALPWLILTDRKHIVRAEGFDLGGLDKKIETATLLAGDVDQVQLQISKGADVNTKDEEGLTALHLAARQGRKDVVELLLANGANINARLTGWPGWMPLHEAAAANHKEVAELLIAKGADANADCARAGGGRFGGTPLHEAVFEGHRDMAELLISKGADINAKQSGGLTPLDVAAFVGHKNVVELLIARGANVNIRDRGGRTALRWAKHGRHKEIVELLQKNGAEE